jgi:hypothetical protein
MILVEFSNLTFERAVATKRDPNVKFIPIAEGLSRAGYGAAVIAAWSACQEWHQGNVIALQ